MKPDSLTQPSLVLPLRNWALNLGREVEDLVDNAKWAIVEQYGIEAMAEFSYSLLTQKELSFFITQKQTHFFDSHILSTNF